MRTDNCCLFQSKKEVINKSAEIKQVIALHKSMWLTCSTSWCFNAKRLHRFKGGLVKFKEGKLIAGYLEKRTLTQEVRISWVKRQRNLLKKALSPPYPISYSLPSSLILATVRNRILCKKKLFFASVYSSDNRFWVSELWSSSNTMRRNWNLLSDYEQLKTTCPMFMCCNICETPPFR